ncbi:tRNA 5-methoxyuridine(34)/uridine 5-oxyacetic acid(34) synthase CmoB [Teredinibacter turnerae]|uniref:tRNA 5-methoxyuridine(34)/uridine 5-oxyacetic acid(34) synthase CmoB n=1 Tax=Teredinibacter turnerae TaxID=2426 RepID=UPI0030D57839
MNSPIDFQPLLNSLTDTPLAPWLDSLPAQLAQGLSTQRFGDLPGWYDALRSLPDLRAQTVSLADTVAIGSAKEVDPSTHQQIEQAFRALIPWRKGPYNLFGTHINTEWRSDWKWQRLAPFIANLKGKQVLDVGCGNGYHCWRMFEAGAAQVIGIDPSPRFVVQFYMIKHFLNNPPVDVLPLGIEALPANLNAFDTTFSMGVLYHRRSPMDHLLELKATLQPGGELVLETLVIEGENGDVLVPEGRYAKMNNVWFLPSVPTLLSWLRKCGFENPRCVDVCTTTTEEQRSTEWMTFQSLKDFLDPTDSSLTAEGHPAPKRAIFVATKR